MKIVINSYFVLDNWFGQGFVVFFVHRMSVNLVCQISTGLIFCFSIVCIIFPIQLVRDKIVLNYALAPPLCVLVIFLSSCLPISTVWQGIRGDPSSIEPYSILLLLYGLAYGCISIDTSGVLALIAMKLARKANNPKKLFFVVFGIASVFTVLTSNDVVILTLTPIVCAVCARSRGTDPLPFLVSMFFAYGKRTKRNKKKSLFVCWFQMFFVGRIFGLHS